jgi:hypothetical protein
MGASVKTCYSASHDQFNCLRFFNYGEGFTDLHLPIREFTALCQWWLIGMEIPGDHCPVRPDQSQQ